MMKLINITALLGFYMTFSLGATAGDFHPHSDPENLGGWKLLEAVSDEFEGKLLDSEKWWVEGTGGVYHKWSGRQPMQFAPDNIRLEDGKLKIAAKWEPDFEFLDKPDGEGQNYENMTAGCIQANTKFKYGYMEAKVKAGLASTTGAFWLTGAKAELDMFELMGAPKQAHKQHLRKRWRSNIIAWETAKGRPVWKEYMEVPFEVGEGFHVYGIEWTPDYLRYYADGKPIMEVTRASLGEDWILDGEMMLWLDSEVFVWQGLPVEEDLPVDYEVEYVRIWQNQ